MAEICFNKIDIDSRVRQVIADSITGINVNDVFLIDSLRGTKLGFTDQGIRELSVPISINNGIFHDIPELGIAPGELVPFANDGVKTVGDIAALVWSKIPSETSVSLKVRKILADEISGLDANDINLTDNLRGTKLNFNNAGIRNLATPLSQKHAIVENLVVTILPDELHSSILTVGDIVTLVWTNIPRKQC